MNVSVLFADELALAEVGTTVIVPEPSTDGMVTRGGLAMLVSTPPAVERSWVVKNETPKTDVAVAPAPPEVLSP